MESIKEAAAKIASLMTLLTKTGGLRLKFRITAGAGAADPDGFERRDIYVECKGPDAGLLTDRDGEVLLALEHVAAKILALESEDHDRVSFDVDGFKAERAGALRDAAAAGVRSVAENAEPYRFEAMSSRERRMLHMFLLKSGMQTASAGEGPRRHVVLYPQGYRIPVEREESGRGDRGRSRPRSGDGRGRF